MGDDNAANVEQVVLSYLQRKGFKQTEEFFKHEAGIASRGQLADSVPENEASLSSYVSHSEQNNPEAYLDSYLRLRQWIENSLDMYKHELYSILYPIFVHTFLDLVALGRKDLAKQFMEKHQRDHMEFHRDDVERLAAITEVQHVEENPLAKTYRSNKYALRISQICFQLFLAFLQDNKFMLLLRIVNQYLSIEVTSDTPGVNKDPSEHDVGITGYSTRQLDRFNQQSIQLGPLPADPAFHREVERFIKGDTKLRKPGLVENAEESTALLEAYSKAKRIASQDSPAREDVPLPPFKTADVHAEISALKDLRKRVALSPNNLPSICIYTLHNTYGSLCCADTTHDATLLAGGFAESYIKIWTLTHEKLRGFKTNFNPGLINDQTDLNRVKERKGHDYKRLVGHCGPVYGLSFSPDKRYLVSCSEDKSARLWSIDTFTNLVCYKGHNYPVWDVDFGPFGSYFATASHDRTARLWRTDYIHPLRIFAGHLSDVNCVRFHPNSKYIVTGSTDKSTRLWNVQNGMSVRVFTGHTGPVHAVAISPDGRLMASGGEDMSIRVWDLGSGKLMQEMAGHKDVIYSLAFSQEGTVLVSGSADNSVGVWNVHRGVDPLMLMTDGDAARGPTSSADQKQYLLGMYPTKQTPVHRVKFTKRNLALAMGPFNP